MGLQARAFAAFPEPQGNTTSTFVGSRKPAQSLGQSLACIAAIRYPPHSARKANSLPSPDLQKLAPLCIQQKPAPQIRPPGSAQLEQMAIYTL
jgi:hypothetical protein